MKILLIGEYYSTNLGDPLLCRVVEESILEAAPDAEIVTYDMSGKTDYASYYQIKDYAFLHKVILKLSALCPFLFQRLCLYRAYQKDEIRYIRALYLLEELLKNNRFDVAVFAGGSIFMDYFAGIIYCIVKRLSFTNTKIVFHACGLSGLSKDSISLINRALNCRNVCSITVRDSYEKFSQTFKTKVHAVETYDTALSCSKYLDEANEKYAEFGIGLIGIPELIKFQKSILQFFLDSSISWKAFTNGSAYDFTFAKKILIELGIPENRIQEYLVDRPLDNVELVKTVTAFDKIVSFRMHSLIVATSYGIPSYGFIWDKKVSEFYMKMNMSLNCALPIDDFDFDTVVGHLNHIDIEQLKANARLYGEESQRALLNAVFCRTVKNKEE